MKLKPELPYCFHILLYSSYDNSFRDARASRLKEILKPRSAIFKDEQQTQLETNFIITDRESISSFKFHQDPAMARYILFQIGHFVTDKQIEEYIEKYNGASFAEYVAGSCLNAVEILREERTVPVTMLTKSLSHHRTSYYRNVYAGKYPDAVQQKRRWLRTIQREMATPSAYGMSYHQACATARARKIGDKLKQGVADAMEMQRMHAGAAPWQSRAAEIYASFQQEDATTRSPLYQTFGLDLMLTLLEYVPLADLVTCTRVSKKFYMICKFIENEHYKRMSYAICSIYGWVTPPKRPPPSVAQSSVTTTTTTTNASATTTTTTTSSVTSSSSGGGKNQKPAALKKVQDFNYKQFYFQTVMPLFYDVHVFLEEHIPPLFSTWNPEYIKAAQPGIMFNATEYMREQMDVFELPIGASKYGGLPDLPDDVEWPVGHVFLAQFNLSSDLQYSLALKKNMPTVKLSTTSDSCTMMYFFVDGGSKPCIRLYTGRVANLERRQVTDVQLFDKVKKEMPIQFIDVAVFPQLDHRRNDVILESHGLPKEHQQASSGKHIEALSLTLDGHPSMYQSLDHAAFYGMFLSPVHMNCSQTLLNDNSELVLLSAVYDRRSYTIIVKRGELRQLNFENVKEYDSAI